MATHSSILAWKIPWAEDLKGYSPWGSKEWDTVESTHTYRHFTEGLVWYKIGQVEKGNTKCKAIQQMGNTLEVNSCPLWRLVSSVLCTLRLCVCVCVQPSCAQLFVTSWTVTHQDPLSMEFCRQEYWSGWPLPSPGIFLTQGSNLGLQHCRQILYHCVIWEVPHLD